MNHTAIKGPARLPNTSPPGLLFFPKQKVALPRPQMYRRGRGTGEVCLRFLGREGVSLPLSGGPSDVRAPSPHTPGSLSCPPLPVLRSPSATCAVVIFGHRHAIGGEMPSLSSGRPRYAPLRGVTAVSYHEARLARHGPLSSPGLLFSFESKRPPGGGLTFRLAQTTSVAEGQSATLCLTRHEVANEGK